MSDGQPEARYVNDVNVGHNAFEFIFDFGQVDLDRTGSWIHTRLILSPGYARDLLRILEESIARYEETFGQIPEAVGYEPLARSDEDGRASMQDREDTSKPGSYDPTKPPGPQPPYTRPTQPAPPDDPSRHDYSWQRDPEPGYDRTEPPPDDPSHYGSGGHTEHGDHDDPHDGYPTNEPAPASPGGYSSTPPDDECGPPDQETEPDCPAPKPADQLVALTAKLGDEESALASLTKRRDTLKQDISGLGDTVTELTKVLTDYTKAIKELDAGKCELDRYVKTKTTMVEADVRKKNKKNDIERCITSTDQWLANWTRHVEHLRQQAADAEQRHTDAADAVKAKEDAYNQLKDAAAQIGKRLAELAALRKQIEDEDDKSATCHMYFLLKELKAALDQIKIKSPKQLECDLYCAWNELSQAKDVERQAKWQWDAAKDLYETKKKARDEHVAKRSETILACISKVCPAGKC